MTGVVSGNEYLVYWIGLGVITVGAVIAAVMKAVFKK